MPHPRTGVGVSDFRARRMANPKYPSLSRKRLLLAATAVAFLALDVSMASAQVAEVVVTARKREENVQNIPVAVTTISGKQVEQFNLTSVEDVAQATPQLLIARGSSGSGADITMRGIGASDENIGIEQSVAVNVDGVYYGQGRAIDEGIFDVGGVQVLKGPQALFFGKNATAGAIAIQTNDPADHYEASLTAGYEFTAEEPYVEGVASGPLSNTFGLRLAFRLSDQNSGYLKQTASAGDYTTYDVATGHVNINPTGIPPNYLGGDKDSLARLTAKWTPTSNLTVTAKGTFDQHHSNNNADNTVNVYCPLGYPQSEVGLTVRSSCGHTFSAPQTALPIVIAKVPGSLFSPGGGQDFEHYQDGNLYLKINYVAPNYTLTSTNAFQHLFNDWADDQNFTAAPSVYGAEHFTWDQFSTEERFNTALSFPINFAGGLYFQTTSLHFNQDVDFAEAQNSAASPANEYVAYSKLSATTGHTYAVFGQAIWDIVKGVEITGGARYTHELKDSYFLQPYVNPTLTGLFVPYDPANPATAIGAHQTFNNVSPEVTLTWKPREDLTLYAAYKTGYKSGGFSNSAILSTLTYPSDLEFKPETSKGFEVGVKSILFDHQLRLNADIFDFLYSNLQVDFFNTPTFNYVTLNAASARTYGVEMEAEYAPKAIQGLVLHFDGAYDNSHYGQFEAPCSPAGLTYEQGCNVLRVVNPNGSYAFSPACGTTAALCDFMNVDGRPTALSPKWTAVVGEDYSRDIGSGLKLGLAVNVRISSGYVANPFPSGVAEQIDHQDAYGTLDAVISLGSLDKHWQLSVIGRNLTNTFIETSTAGLPLSGGTTGCRVSSCGPQVVSDQAATVDNPRTIALQLKYRY
jgi:iron complex outermembrane receptor protein